MEIFMSKFLTITFEMSGTQVDADYFSNEIWDDVKEMAKAGDHDLLDLYDHIENNRHEDGVIIANGIIADSDMLTCKIEDDSGNKIEADILQIDSNSTTPHKTVLEQQGLEKSKFILLNKTENMSVEKKENNPTKEQNILLKISEYDYGQLVGVFKVDDDFNIFDINMNDFVLKTLDLDGDTEISQLTYSNGYTGNEGDADIIGLTYKGEEVFLDLNFQGGNGENVIFIREGDGFSSVDIEEML
jgi:hypothetical protein